MPFRRIAGTSVFLVALLVSSAAVASAATITFNTSDSQFDPGVDNQGWWSFLSANADSNDNYFTGAFPGFADTHRSFFTFDLSTLDLSGQTLVSATFEAVRYTYPAGEASETIAFFDVSTDAVTLNANNGTSAAIFNDLGSGVTYGSFVVPAYAPSSVLTLTFSLNNAALTDIASAAGGFFSIGGALQSGVGVIFSNSSGAGVQRLILETEPTAAAAVPEPTSLLLLGTGAAGLLARVRRRRNRRG